MTIEELCAKANYLAAQAGIMLRWNAEGLEEVETKIMPALQRMAADGRLNEIAVHNWAMVFGVYLGELILRNFAAEQGWRWNLESEDGLPLLTDGRQQLNPAAKVYHRITQGEADDLRSFYRISRAIVSGKLKF